MLDIGYFTKADSKAADFMTADTIILNKPGALLDTGLWPVSTAVAHDISSGRIAATR
ncbi:MAG: hypothetical protein R3D34_13115 [Nitratireductor sp.]